MISIVIPIYKEKKNLYKIKRNLKLLSGMQVIIVDGGSKKNILNFFKGSKLDILKSKPSRGLQMFLGAKKAKYNWLLFMHADTFLNKENILDIKKFLTHKNKNNIGYFKLNFSSKNKFAKLISKWCFIRTKLFRLPFGDQCLVISRDYYFFLGGHRNIRVMEDLDFILKVPYSNRVLLSTSIKTSFIKYENNGVLRQSFKHLICQILFLLKVNQSFIEKKYFNH